MSLPPFEKLKVTSLAAMRIMEPPPDAAAFSNAKLPVNVWPSTVTFTPSAARRM